MIKKLKVTDLVLVILSMHFWIGIRYWFPVCTPMSDSFMSCHWAGEMLKAISWLIFAIFLIHALVKDKKIKLGLDISAVCILILTAAVPGGIINLCQDAAMQCRASTQLSTIVCSIVMIVVTLADGVFYLSKISKEEHAR